MLNHTVTNNQFLKVATLIYEVVLHATVTIKLGEAAEEKQAFLIDIRVLPVNKHSR